MIRHLQPLMLLLATKFSSRAFRIKLSKISDPDYFKEIINTPHSIQQTNAMLNAIRNGGNGINRGNFESTIFRKYSYYIEKLPDSSAFEGSTVVMRVEVLENVSEIYSKMGKLSTKGITKSFNKIADSINNDLSQMRSPPVDQVLRFIISLHQYNPNKSKSLFKKNYERYLNNTSTLKKMTAHSAFLYLRLINAHRSFAYNRLIFEQCIDVLYHELEYVTNQQLEELLLHLATSHIPVNKQFVTRAIGRVQRLLNTHHPLLMSGNVHVRKQELHVLSSLSLIEKNLNLASAYLPELFDLFQVAVMDLCHFLKVMSDYELGIFSSIIRRIYFYDDVILKMLEDTAHRREIQDFSLDFKGPGKEPQISMNTLCSILHTMAVYNRRSLPFINYFLDVLTMIPSEKLSMIHRKHYSRIVWSMCVVGRKEELSRMYPLITVYLKQANEEHFPEHEALNFYYCYLLLKTYFPRQNFIDFSQSLQQKLGNKLLDSSISETHQIIYEKLLAMDVPCLKEFNISNLMCDIFIPRYKNCLQIVIDVHGYHHFMRNCSRLDGSGALKAKILQDEGYIYQYISVEEWQMADDKHSFLTMLLDQIDRVHSQKQNKKEPVSKNLVNKGDGELSNKQLLQRESKGRGRRVQSNSQMLLKKLN